MKQQSDMKFNFVPMNVSQSIEFKHKEINMWHMVPKAMIPIHQFYQVCDIGSYDPQYYYIIVC